VGWRIHIQIGSQEFKHLGNGIERGFDVSFGDSAENYSAARDRMRNRALPCRHYFGSTRFVILPADQQYRAVRVLDVHLSIESSPVTQQIPLESRAQVRKGLAAPCPGVGKIDEPYQVEEGWRRFGAAYATTALMDGYIDPSCGASSPPRVLPTAAIRSGKISGRFIIHVKAWPN
jgi:hypothetical protein